MTSVMPGRKNISVTRMQKWIAPKNPPERNLRRQRQRRAKRARQRKLRRKIPPTSSRQWMANLPLASWPTERRWRDELGQTRLPESGGQAAFPARRAWAVGCRTDRPSDRSRDPQPWSYQNADTVSVPKAAMRTGKSIAQMDNLFLPAGVHHYAEGRRRQGRVAPVHVGSGGLFLQVPEPLRVLHSQR